MGKGIQRWEGAKGTRWGLGNPNTDRKQPQEEDLPEEVGLLTHLSDFRDKNYHPLHPPPPEVMC